jgi:hypothetical protein
MTARYFSEAMPEEFEMAFSCSRYRPVTAVGGERRSCYRGRWHRRLIHLPADAFKHAEMKIRRQSQVPPPLIFSHYHPGP